MNSFALEGQTRETLGGKATKALRRDGRIPCVLYGVDENLHFSVTSKEVKNLVYTPKFNKVELSVSGNTHAAILKDMQFDPVTERLEHIDFLALQDDRKVTVEIPIEFTGLAEGVKEGGKLMPKLRRLKIKALPDDLIDKVEVDVTHVELGKSVKVSEVELENVEIITSTGIPMASVEIPRALRSAQAGEEGDEIVEGAEGAEGEAAADGDAAADDDSKK